MPIARPRVVMLLLSMTVATCVLLPMASAPAYAAPRSSKLSLSQTIAAARQIDAYISAGYREHRVQPNPVASDEAFVRRAYLGIAGRIPSYAETVRFLKDGSSTRRTRLVEQLIASDDYNFRMLGFYGDLLRVQSSENFAGAAWHAWLQECIDKNMPYDQMVYEMLAAEGDAVDNPAVGYYLRDRGMLLDNVSNTMEVFLGTQMTCAQCHDHPFNDWTQMDYYQVAAFTSGLQYKSERTEDTVQAMVAVAQGKPGNAAGGMQDTMMSDSMMSSSDDASLGKPKKNKKRGKETQRPRKMNSEADRANARDFRDIFDELWEQGITENPKRDLYLPKEQQVDAETRSAIQPRLPFGPEMAVLTDENRRKTFARWVTSEDNPLFAKVIANRLWKHVYGHGLVEPIDDFEMGNDKQGSHPKLLAYLADLMVRLDFDTKQFQRVLYHTKTFQRRVDMNPPPAGKAYYFPGPVLRRMTAEQVWDSLITLRNPQDVTQRDGKRPLIEAYESRRDEIIAFYETDPKKLIQYDEEYDAYYDGKRDQNVTMGEAYRAYHEAKQAGDAKAEAAAQARIQELRKNRRSVASYGEGAEMVNTANSNIKLKYEKKAARLRAADLPAPTRGNHFLAAFGASDRNTSNAANDDASVPQALYMLNGDATERAIIRNKAWKQALTGLSPAQRLDRLFVAIYSRRPTREEVRRLTPIIADESQWESVPRAMLNSRSFLFIQ